MNRKHLQCRRDNPHWTMADQNDDKNTEDTEFIIYCIKL